MEKFDLIDFLKGYSIFAIMIFHYCQFLEPPSPYDQLIFFGGTGIHLFILLSGFGLYYSFKRRPMPYLKFLRKRLLKVYVPYIIIVLISALIALFIPIYENSLYAVGGHVFFYKMFDESIMGSYGYPFWFISMIIQFYLTFHIFAWIKSKLKGELFLALGVFISIAWAVFTLSQGKEAYRTWNSFFLQYAWEFMLGIYLAERLSNNQSLNHKWFRNHYTLLLSILSCVVFLGLALYGGAEGKLLNDYFGLAGFSFLALWIYQLKIGFVNRFFLYIGSISLSVYLLHFVLMLILSQLFSQLDGIFIIGFSLALIFPLSSIYQKGVNWFFKVSKL